MTFQIVKFAWMQKLFLWLFAIAIIIAQCGCSGNDSNVPISYGEDYLLNTYCSITIYEEGKEDAIREAFAYARSLENLLSRTIQTSDIGRFNADETLQPLEVSKDTASVVQRGLHYGEISEGLFDISIGALTALWDFSADVPVVPGEAAIEEALKNVDYHAIEVYEDSEEGKYFLLKKNPGARIDLGGIAKGYIADRVYGFLKERGISVALINFGGNVLTLGQKQEGALWNVGLEKPFAAKEGEALAERELMGMISFEGGSIVTSGTYERKFYEDGVLYYHILDPKTGYPRLTDLVSVTIIGPSSTECDALSTVCLMMGLDQAFAFMESSKDYEAVFISETGETLATSGAAFIAY
ncbi:MAG: FAD:protein FMN transferase [Clostridia bacterium]|nr:FAD:protein FMN transferase [Clostridia bacterium]